MELIGLPHLFRHTEEPPAPRSVIPLSCQQQAPLPSASSTLPVSYIPFFVLLPSAVCFDNSLEPGEPLSGQKWSFKTKSFPLWGRCQGKSVAEIPGNTVAGAWGAIQTFPPAELVFWGCWRSCHKLGGVRRQKCILPQSWRPEVCDQFPGAEIKV